ncbi:MAG: PorT family protein [Prolixibacteraceae bacterium]|nr:PorT family protein [Prolixibacteraceae bacterium]
MKQIKHTVLLITALIFMVSTVNAKNLTNNSNSKLQVGLKIGANLSNIYDAEDESLTADSKFGLAGGAFASIPIGSFLGIQPEFLFSQKGYKGSGSILGSEYTYSRTSNFIDVPIFVAVKPISKLTLLLGPQYSFLIKETYKFENELIDINEEQEFKNDNIRKNTLCVVGGLDVNLNQLIIGARVGWDLQNNNGDGTSTTPRYKNIWYQATLGFRLSGN